MGRIVAVAALVVAVAVVGYVLVRGAGEKYVVKATFENASQLVRGNEVQVAGVKIGSVEDMRLTNEGMAEVSLRIENQEYVPVRRGTEAIVRMASLTGVANRYIDLRLPPGKTAALPNGGRIPTSDTTSAVDLDQLLDALDENARKDLQGVIQGFGKQYSGRAKEAARGWLYLNPNLAATSRLFEELTRDTPALKEFIGANAQLMTDLASKREDLAGVVDELATMTGAIGNRKESLADAIHRLPPFLRRANTTFVNLRAALDDLRPLVEESKPVTPKLRRFLAELRPFVRDARPTIRDLSRTVRQPGADNDLVELTRGQVPLAKIAMGPVERNGKERQGAFPASTDALRKSIPELAYARPYAVDLTGWFDDFGHSGLYDALGGKSRVGTYVNAFAQVEGVLRPIPEPLRPQADSQVYVTGQRNRCPGAAEHPADDRSNPWKPTPDHNCDPSQVLPGG
jgi:phospholipid/cholesterol/gamma-HCH transport system substrate-binding protein